MVDAPVGLPTAGGAGLQPAQQAPNGSGGCGSEQPGWGSAPDRSRQGASAGARSGAGVLAAAVAVMRRALGPRR
eukprot:2825433-Lingulodinium_polyedra.AAC.1